MRRGCGWAGAEGPCGLPAASEWLWPGGGGWWLCVGHYDRTAALYLGMERRGSRWGGLVASANGIRGRQKKSKNSQTKIPTSVYYVRVRDQP